MSINRTDPLIEIFDDCVNRLNSGASVANCLRAYPQVADQLRPMLETVQVMQRNLPLAVNRAELLAAKDRVRTRLLDMQTVTPSPVRQQKTTRLPILAAAAASLLILLLGLALIAETSLPGDPLFSVKLLTEGVRITLSGDDVRRAQLESQFNQRRLAEIDILLSAGRVAEVAFIGTIARIEPATWTVAGLSLEVTATTTGYNLGSIGREVRVSALTQPDGTLRALSIGAVDEDDPPPPISETPTPTETTASTLAVTPTVTPTATRSATATVTATITASPSGTSIQTATATLTATATRTPTLIPTATSSACVPTLPTNWIRYQVQSGDTLSALAVATGTTVQVLIEVNCIRNPSLLILGQVLFLPREPLIQGDAAGDDDDDDGGVGDIDSGGDDDSGDDDGDDDDSGGDDDDGDDDDSGDDD